MLVLDSEARYTWRFDLKTVSCGEWSMVWEDIAPVTKIFVEYFEGIYHFIGNMSVELGIWPFTCFSAIENIEISKFTIFKHLMFFYVKAIEEGIPSFSANLVSWEKSTIPFFNMCASSHFRITDILDP